MGKAKRSKVERIETGLYRAGVEELIEVHGRELPEPEYVVAGRDGVQVAWRDVAAAATCSSADIPGRPSVVLSFGRASAAALRDALTAALAS